ncbi:MAG: radical SAM protein [Candidatus Woesearchaeota archaeon]|nr:radical SAM protein [Candidatus Woesearchaeota archaeon]
MAEGQRKDISEKRIDEFVREVAKTECEIVGISVHVMAIDVANRISSALRKLMPEIKIIYGGPYLSREFLLLSQKNKEILSLDADAYTFGEGEETLSEIVRNLGLRSEIGNVRGAFIKKDDALIYCGEREKIIDIDSLPFPDFSDFPPENYLEKATLPIMFSRGCLNRCSFCRDCALWGKYRARKAQSIFAEMKQQMKSYDARNFNCNDLMLNGDLEMLNELSELIISNGLNVGWGGMAITREDMSISFLKKLKQAGCTNMDIGIESGSEKIRRKMGKSPLQIAEKSIRAIHEAGIRVNSTWLIGYPGETRLDFMKTLWFMFKVRKYLSEIISNVCHIPLESRLFTEIDKIGISIKNDSCYDTMRWYLGLNTPREREIRMKIFHKFVHILKININKQ